MWNNVQVSEGRNGMDESRRRPASLATTSPGAVLGRRGRARPVKLALWVMACLLSVSVNPSAFAAAPAPRIAIIKADDIRQESPQMDRFIDLAREKNVKVSLGVICDSLENDPDGSYARWLSKLVKSGDVELWHHGWDHSKRDVNGATIYEFSNSGPSAQKEHLEKAEELMKEKTGVSMAVFGAPYNAMDADTAAVLNDRPDIVGVFCYNGNADSLSVLRGKVLLPMTLRGEGDGTGKPDFEKFKQDYAKRGTGLRFAAIQFHPAFFDQQRLGEFGQIVDFLKAEGWIFMLPAEYIERSSHR